MGQPFEGFKPGVVRNAVSGAVISGTSNPEVSGLPVTKRPYLAPFRTGSPKNQKSCHLLQRREAPPRGPTGGSADRKRKARRGAEYKPARRKQTCRSELSKRIILTSFCFVGCSLTSLVSVPSATFSYDQDPHLTQLMTNCRRARRGATVVCGLLIGISEFDKLWLAPRSPQQFHTNG